MPPRPIPRNPPGARGLAFGLSYLAYFSYYLGRKVFSVVKVRLRAELGLTEATLATLDAAYLACYAGGQFLAGSLGDRFGPRRLLGGGMLLSALACAASGHATGAAALLVAFSINGVAQASGWPGTSKVMAAFTTTRDRGAIMGVWSTCYQFGGVAATGLAAFLLSHRGWRAAFYGPALLVAAVGIVVGLFIPEAPAAPEPPEAPGLTGAEDSRDAPSSTSPSGAPRGRAPVTAIADDEAAQRWADQRAVLRSAALWSYGGCYFALKLIRYSLLFWLPYYLFQVLHFDEERAGYLSTSFEIGGFVGVLGLGLLSDRVRSLSRAGWSALSTLLLGAALLAYAQLSPVGWLGNALLLGLIGALLFGPDSILAGAAAQDLGGRRAAATAAGIINGLGSLGAILQGYLTVGISQRYGWSALFHVFVGLSVAGAICLWPALREVRTGARAVRQSAG